MRGHQLFFLGGALFGGVAIGMWLGVLDGALPAPGALAPAQWHAHEMLFGYTSAVLAGFLLTGSSGWRPAFLFALWLAGRAAVAAALAIPAWLVGAVDLALLPAVALLRTPPLWNRLKWPTLSFVPLLLCLFAANLLWHLEAIGALAGGADAGARLALDLFTLMIVVMAGRLVPGYTRAMLIPVRTPKDPLREKWSIAIGLALLISDQLGWGLATGGAAIALGALQAWRFAGWRTRDVFRQPILLVLHLGFFWLVLGLLLRGLAELTPLMAPADAIHAITVGAIGTLTIGMMGRLARIHARRAVSATRVDTLSYIILSGAAIMRVALPPIAPEGREGEIVVAGALWVLALCLFVVAHGSTLAFSRTT
jgi:uncharacterized protein involved in response to NO